MSAPSGSPGKYIRLSPKPQATSTGYTANGLTPHQHLGSSPSSGASGVNINPMNPPTQAVVAASTPSKSPIRRPRGDAKKCRKVYGMNHREQWCTQCKWKKACTRFGENN